MASALREDMITTFDACLALKPQRKDIIELYMKSAHLHLLDVLGRYWERNAVDMNVSTIPSSFSHTKHSRF